AQVGEDLSQRAGVGDVHRVVGGISTQPLGHLAGAAAVGERIDHPLGEVLLAQLGTVGAHNAHRAVRLAFQQGADAREQESLGQVAGGAQDQQCGVGHRISSTADVSVVFSLCLACAASCSASAAR